MNIHSESVSEVEGNRIPLVAKSKCVLVYQSEFDQAPMKWLE